MIYTRISSGFDFIDAAYGGLYSNRTYLLRGPAQSGRTTFALQYLLAGYESGEAGILISSERLDNLIIKSESMGFPLETALMENKLILLEYPFEILSGNFQLGGVVHFLGEIEQYVKNNGCTRLVFDTFVPLLARVNEAQLSNYVYSLTESLEQLYVTTLLITGHPNSPTAARIVELLEDAAVGSFVLDVPLRTSPDQKTFSIHKMINPFFPPITYNVQIEYGRGFILNVSAPTMSNESKYTLTPQLQDVPINCAILDRNDETREEIEDIFNRDSQIEQYSSAKELVSHLGIGDFDLIVVNASTIDNWADVLRQIRDHNSKQAIFVIATEFAGGINYQSVKQAGADGLFVYPVVKAEIIKAFEKTLVKHETLDAIVAKRTPAMTVQQLPSGVNEFDELGKGIDNTIVTYPVFKEIMNMQIIRDYPNKRNFSLVSFRLVNTTTSVPGQQSPHDGVQAFHQIADTIRISMRNTGDRLCRHMNKILVMLTECDREGSELFIRRVINELKSGTHGQRVLLGKQLMLFTSISVFPDDAINEQDLLSQVSDNNRNMTLLN